jgi:hypothetical protein
MSKITEKTGATPKHVISFILFIDPESIPMQAKDVKWLQKNTTYVAYVTGLVESIRVCKILLPGYTIAVYMPEGTIGHIERLFAEPPGQHPWTNVPELVKKELNSHQVKLHSYVVPPLNLDGWESPHLTQGAYRFQALRDYHDANIIMIRDVDSPPTAADVAAVNLWESNGYPDNILSYCLTNRGVFRAGGCLTFHRPRDTLPAWDVLGKLWLFVDKFIPTDMEHPGMTGKSIDEAWIMSIAFNYHTMFGNSYLDYEPLAPIRSHMVYMEFDTYSGVYYTTRELEEAAEGDMHVRTDLKFTELYATHRTSYEYFPWYSFDANGNAVDSDGKPATNLITHYETVADITFDKHGVVVIDRIDESRPWAYYGKILNNPCKADLKSLDDVIARSPVFPEGDALRFISLERTKAHTCEDTYAYAHRGYREI